MARFRFVFTLFASALFNFTGFAYAELNTKAYYVIESCSVTDDHVYKEVWYQNGDSTSADAIRYFSLYNAQKSNIFQPGKDFGSSATIYLRSGTPRFEDDKRYNLRVNMKAGSFDLINPSLLYEYKIK